MRFDVCVAEEVHVGRHGPPTLILWNDCRDLLGEFGHGGDQGVAPLRAPPTDGQPRFGTNEGKRDSRYDLDSGARAKQGAERLVFRARIADGPFRSGAGQSSMVTLLRRGVRTQLGGQRVALLESSQVALAVHTERAEAHCFVARESSKRGPIPNAKLDQAQCSAPFEIENFARGKLDHRSHGYGASRTAQLGVSHEEQGSDN